MDIPLEMLIEYMGYLNPELRLLVRDMWVTGIKMMPDDGVISSDYVYFAQLRPGLITPEGAPLVVTCPKFYSPPDELDNCIILHTDIPATVVFNEMLGLQNLIRQWRQEVEISITRSEGVQRLLDLSVRVFGNPIAIITTSFKTIAATWEYETEDLVFRELLELGYLTQVTFNKLQERGYFKSERFTGDSYEMEANPPGVHKTILTAVMHEGAVVFLVLMLCSNTPVSRGLLQLYEVFIEKLRYYLQPAAAKGDYLRNQFDYFVIDIIEGRVSTPRDMEERSLGFPPAYTNEFQTVLVTHESTSVMFLDHAMSNISALFPNVRLILHNGIIIMHPELESTAVRENFFTTLSAYLGGAHAYAGVSEPSVGLLTLRESYRQAFDAFILGRRLQRENLSESLIDHLEKQKRIFYFRDYHVYSMLKGNETEPGILDLIRKYDIEHNTDYYRILFVFLNLERSFTKCAVILHMHRNNVIYHIKRICDIFDIDLDDANQRLRLLMLYKLNDLKSVE